MSDERRVSDDKRVSNERRVGYKGRKRIRKVGAVVLVYALAWTSVGVPALKTTVSFAASKPKLESSKGTLLTGETKTVKIKNVKKKNIKKLKVTSTKKSVATASKSGKTSVIIKSKKAGKTTVKVSVLLKNKKKYNLIYKATVSDMVERKVDVRCASKKAYKMKLRFYAKTPHIPYVSVKALYSNVTEGKNISVQKSSKDNYLLTVPSGEKATVNTKTDEMVVDSPTFSYCSKVNKISKNSSYTETPFLYPYDDEIIEPIKPYSISFGKYDIDIKGDTEDIWLPLEIANNMFFSDESVLTMTYAGGRVYHFDNGDTGNYFSEEYLNDFRLSNPDGIRPDDLVEYSYNELAFVMDTIFGCPKRCKLSDAIKEKGFDRVLEETNDVTRRVREMLKSKDMDEYLWGLAILSDIMFDGGHTRLDLMAGFLYGDLNMLDEKAKSIGYSIADELRIRHEKRDACYRAKDAKGWNDSYYHEKGDTAVYSFNFFYVDIEAWKEYYKNGGEIPDDTYGNFIKCLNKASESKNIKNFVLDLTCNSGGDDNAGAALLGIITGDSDLYAGYSRSGGKVRIPFKVDKNLDGKFDEKDNEVKYDFNYAVLTSGNSFSCANLFNCYAKEKGIMSIGEKTAGGSCAILIMPIGGSSLGEISSQRSFFTPKGVDTDEAVEPDKVIEIRTDADGNADYSGFYDIDALSQYINEFYK